MNRVERKEGEGLLTQWQTAVNQLFPVGLWVKLTINTLYQCFKVLKPLWYILLLLGIFMGGAYWCSQWCKGGYPLLAKIIAVGALSFLFFLVIMTTRPSMTYKSLPYFIRYSPFFIVAILMGLAADIHFLWVATVWYFLFFVDDVCSYNPCCWSLTIYRSFYKTANMYIALLPLIILIGGALSLIQVIVPALIMHYIILPISICIYTNMYIRARYDDFERYC